MINSVLDKLPIFAILGVLIAGCARPAEPGSKSPQDVARVTAPDDQKAKPPGNPGPGDAQGPSNVEKPAPDRTSSGREKPAEKDSGPTYGLPLEIDLKPPEVPKKIEGPTPPDQLKKST